MAFHNLLCAVDFSAGSQPALRMAGELAKDWGAKLTLIHAYHVPVPRETFPDRVMAREVDRVVAEIGQKMAEWKREAEAAGAPSVEILTVQGEAWERIVEVARERKHDLIVLGTHGRTGLKRALLGSVAEKVVRHAPCPALVARTG